MLQMDPLTPRIIGAALKVHSALGPGLPEKTYERCLQYKLEAEGLRVERQVVVPVRFESLSLPGAFRVDLIVENSVIIELKVVEKLTDLHLAQVITYLKLTNLRYGLLLNFNTVHLRDGLRRVLNG